MADIKVPVFSESVTEGTLLAWHKKPGEAVKRGDLLAEIETDKVVLEIQAQQDGVLQSVLKHEGDTVLSEELLGTLGEAGSAAAPPPAPAATQPAATPAAAGAPSNEARRLDDLSPAVRKIIVENNLDPAQIPATGPRGTITKADALGAIGQAQAAAPAQPVAEAAEATPAPVAPAAPVSAPAQETPAPTQVAPAVAQPQPTQAAAPVQAPAATPAAAASTAPASNPALAAGARPEQRVPMTRIRARIAERLKEVQNTAALLTTFNEVNMQPAMNLRKKYQDQFVAKHGVKLGFMSLFVRAATEALKAFPVVNASVDGKDIIYHGYYDIGIAVASERGLVVPILRDTESMSLAGIEKQIADYAQKAKTGKLTLEDMSGGTFSITNGGTFGSMMSTPIINAPQSAILGMHNIIERPIAQNGQVVIAPMMYLALSYDHRIIDGKEAVQFLVMIKNLLEDPARMLLEL